MIFHFAIRYSCTYSKTSNLIDLLNLVYVIQSILWVFCKSRGLMQHSTLNLVPHDHTFLSSSPGKNERAILPNPFLRGHRALALLLLALDLLA
jgi:hypothetical protein